jgi:hypothetical protein
MFRFPALLLALAVTCYAQVAPTAPAPTAPSPGRIGEAEAAKVEDRIASVRRDSLGKYETALGDMQAQMQKAADLEGAIAVRNERARLTKEQALSEKNFVNEPKSLRALQQQTVGRMNDLVSSVVADSLPKLIEYKKQLTIDGKLDDALAVKQAIERLQNANVPISRTEAGSIVTADSLIQSYGADRARADKTYKGVRFVARGVMGGYRLDPADDKSLVVYLAPQSGTGWVQCAFNLALFRYREDHIGNGTYLVLISRDGSEVRLGRGQTVDIVGDCTGWDENVKLAKCDVSR